MMATNGNRFALLMALALCGCDSVPAVSPATASLGGTDQGVAVDADEPEGLIWEDHAGGLNWAQEWWEQDGEIYIAEDISVGPRHEVLADHRRHSATPAGREAKAAMDTTRRRLWGGGRAYEGGVGVVRYRIDDTFSDAKRDDILAAVALWNSLADQTGIRWLSTPQLERQQAGVFFEDAETADDKCRTRLGRHPRRNNINLGRNANCSQETIVHEMGHSMGLWHEHKRPDRGRYVSVYEFNADPQSRFDFSVHPGNENRPFRRDSRFRMIGVYDIDSVMHYYSVSPTRSVGDIFGGSYNRPQFLSTSEYDLRRVLVSPNGPELVVSPDWNTRARIEDGGGAIGDTNVQDVNGDGRDDLVLVADQTVAWSSQGKSAWIPVREVGGDTVVPGTAATAVGDFDGDGTPDVVTVDRSTWSVFLSTVGQETTFTKQSCRSLEVGDLNRDGMQDLICIERNRSWSIFYGPDITLGSLRVLRPVSMEVDSVRIVNFTQAGPTMVVGLRNGVLSYSVLGVTQWRNVFVGASNPLPQSARLHDLFFVHLDDAATSATAQVDLVAVSDGSDGSGVGVGMAVWLPNILGSTPTGMRAFAREGTPALEGRPPSQSPDFRVGDFEGTGRAQFLTLASFVRPATPPLADTLAIGTRYGGSPYHGWSGTRLADRYPVDPSRNPLVDYETSLLPGERVELSGSFVSTTRVSSIDVVVQRRGASGWVTQATSTFSGGAHDFEVRYDFEAGPVGEWRVQMLPTERFSSADVPTWLFRVGSLLPVCGNGFVEQGESCDDANGNENDACLSNCRAAVCGDGVMRTGVEQCDDGNSINSDACLNACTVAVCGDGALWLGVEQCDDGNVINGDLCSSSCAATGVNTPPIIVSASVLNYGIEFGDAFLANATATDGEDATIPESRFIWTLSFPGSPPRQLLGRSVEFEVYDLGTIYCDVPNGYVTVTLRVEDSGGASTQRTVAIDSADCP